MMHRLVLPLWLLATGMSAFASPSASQSPDKFQIMNGDSLSSISKTVFGDAKYWPRVWSSDSHILSPGNSIQFLLGNEESAPAFAISESDDDSGAGSAPPALQPAAAKNNSEVEIPPPQVRPKPVLSLGTIMPPWGQVRHKRSGFKDYSVEVYPRKTFAPVDRELIPVYVQDSPVSSIGEYIQTSSDAGLVYEGEEVLIRIKSGSGQVGGHYLMLRDAGPMKDGWNGSGGEHSGHVVEVLGEVVLTENEPESDGGYDHFRARVLHAVSVSVRGALVVPGQVTWMNTSPTGSFSSVQAEVIGGNFDQRGMLFGEGDWVFLNRGAKDGLQEGQLIWTSSLASNYETDSPFKVGMRNSSLIKIAKVASEVSTGLVIKSKQALMQHDFASGSATQLRSQTIQEGPSGGNGDDLSNDLNDTGNSGSVAPTPEGDAEKDGGLGL